VPEWAQVLLAVLTVAGSVLGSVAAVSFRSGSRLTKIDAAIAANALAIGELTKAVSDRATAETARGLQAQLTRQEAQIASNAAEANARIDRHGARVDKVEEAHAARESATAAILGRLEAGVASLKESVDRLIAAESEQRRAPSQQGLLDQLRQFAELQKMLKATA
jgi:hypothetical protein